MGVHKRGDSRALHDSDYVVSSFIPDIISVHRLFESGNPFSRADIPIEHHCYGVWMYALLHLS